MYICLIFTNYHIIVIWKNSYMTERKYILAPVELPHLSEHFKGREYQQMNKFLLQITTTLIYYTCCIFIIFSKASSLNTFSMLWILNIGKTCFIRGFILIKCLCQQSTLYNTFVFEIGFGVRNFYHAIKWFGGKWFRDAAYSYFFSK